MAGPWLTPACLSKRAEARVMRLRAKNGPFGPLVTLSGQRHDGGMAREFQPGHPIAFWLAIVGLVYGMYAGGMAVVHVDDCRDHGVTEQHWRFLPPEWVCGTD
jgi:hypothetical protein